MTSDVLVMLRLRVSSSSNEVSSVMLDLTEH